MRPDRHATLPAEHNVIAGNVIGYGATTGELFLRGQVGERFCVRNSGATAVVEGVGDHACEYMTGGRVLILGPTGRNVAAGMSGGVAYVLDLDADRVNTELVDLDPLRESDEKVVHDLLVRHRQWTGSAVAAGLLADWDRRPRPLHPGHAAGLQARPRRAGRGRARGSRRRRAPGVGADHGGLPWLTPRVS